jgi:hypothetical protein
MTLSKTLPLELIGFIERKSTLVKDVRDIQVVSVRPGAVDSGTVIDGDSCLVLTNAAEPGRTPYLAMHINNNFWIITNFDGWRQFQIINDVDGPLVVNGITGSQAILLNSNGVYLTTADRQVIQQAVAMVTP